MSAMLKLQPQSSCRNKTHVAPANRSGEMKTVWQTFLCLQGSYLFEKPVHMSSNIFSRRYRIEVKHNEMRSFEQKASAALYPRFVLGSTPSFPNSVWERTWAANSVCCSAARSGVSR